MRPEIVPGATFPDYGLPDRANDGRGVASGGHRVPG